MRPLGTPPTPRARSRAMLPVGIAATRGWLSGWGLKATPAPRRRSTSASAAPRSRVKAGAGGGASRTVGVCMMGGLLCGRRDTVAPQAIDGVGRDGGPVAFDLALGSADPGAAVPTPG